MVNHVLPQHLRGHRILAAIVFTDAVSFSARMSQDEEHTLDLISRDIQRMSELCERFEGQVLKSTGDGLLMYFTSAVSAVACAQEIQKQLSEAAMHLPPNDRLVHRIGIHLGDVFFSEDDVMGNGVNIAARLQTLAEPGGICLSQTVYDVVKKSLSVEVSYLGPQELKNIQGMVPVYQILLASRRVAADSQLQAQAKLLTRKEHRDRQILLNKVNNYWVKGVLEKSIHGQALIELGLQERLDALERPWGLVWESPEQARQTLPPGFRAIDKFDEMGAGRTLLILGEPGAGKTTTLLELARDAIARAERDIYQPIPVVFNLSSWRNERQAIADWLVGELASKYQVSKKISRVWIQEQQLLLLLDGLDEVRAARRDTCIRAINRFSQEFGRTEIVVCSRLRDYEALASRLQFQAALYLQPLNDEQIHSYLASAGAELAVVNAAIASDATLRELARSPLMLSIMTLAYRNLPPEELPRISAIEERRKHLFDAYIQRMFARRGAERRYPNEKAKRWLIWLAQKMSQQSQTVFLIERLQPDWLETTFQKGTYNLGVALILGPLVGMIVGPAAWLIVALIGWLIDQPSLNPLETLNFLLNEGLIGGLCEGLLWGLMFELLGDLMFVPIGRLIFAAISGLAWALFWTLSWGLEVGLILGFIGGLTGTLLWALMRKPIHPFETLKWFWSHAKNNLIYGLFWGLIFGLFVGPFQQSMTSQSSYYEWIVNSDSSQGINWPLFIFFSLIYALAYGLIFEGIGGLIALLIGGMTGSEIETKTVPNQGIWQSVRNAFVLAMLGVLLLGIAAGIVGIPVMAGMMLGLLFGLFRAGDACIKHLILRLILCCYTNIPWNYARFLNYATDCIFLQKVGGGYIFIHRLLLEHFAEMTLAPEKH